MVIVLVNEGNSLTRSSVRQTEENVVGAVYKSCSFSGVFSELLAYLYYLDVVSALETLLYLQSGSTFLTVYINLNRHIFSSCIL